ncbi:MAG: DnaD domain protein [Oscillospiraceae bacterium]
MYRMDMGLWGGIFAVPNEVVDKHIRMCGPLSLKVLLVMLRAGEPMAAEVLAERLGQTVGDIRDALGYWVQVGVIQDEAADEKPTAPTAQVEVAESAAKSEQSRQEPIQAEVAPAAQAVQEEKSRKTVHSERFRRMSRQDLNECAMRDKNLGGLLQEAQDILGRLLSNGESEMIGSLYYNYGMPADILLMLLHYCRSIGKETPAFIERMALDWINREIVTHERAEKELKRLAGRGEKEQLVRETLSIKGHTITDKELGLFASWQKEFGMSQQMIRLAYERNVEIKGKFSFSYVNAILKSWKEQGITTPEKALQDMKGGAQSAAAKTPAKQGRAAEPKASYDLDKLEKIIANGNIWD